MSAGAFASRADTPARRPRHLGLRHDREKYYSIAFGTIRPSLLRRCKVWFWHLVLPCVAVYRFGQLASALWERNRLLGALPLGVFGILQLGMRLMLHVELPRSCRIGPGLFLGHPYGIIVGPTDIGANCNLTHGVTVGMGLGARGRGIPVIGDNVWIGAGSILTGPIHVGDGATVSAGSVVSRDVPPGALVAGNPARVVAAHYDNSALLGYALPARSGGSAPVRSRAPGRVFRRRRRATQPQVEADSRVAVGGDLPTT